MSWPHHVIANLYKVTSVRYSDPYACTSRNPQTLLLIESPPFLPSFLPSFPHSHSRPCVLDVIQGFTVHTRMVTIPERRRSILHTFGSCPWSSMCLCPAVTMLYSHFPAYVFPPCLLDPRSKGHTRSQNLPELK